MSSEIVIDIFNARLKEITFISFKGKSVLSKDSRNARKIVKDR